MSKKGAFIYQQIELTTAEWATDVTVYPASIWLFERLESGKFNMKLADGVHMFAELPAVMQDITATVKTNDATTYILTITTAAGAFDTPNLRGTDAATVAIDPVTKHMLIGGVDTGVKVEGIDGKSAFEVWQSQEGNADKTINDYLSAIKGDPFTYADFTPEQLEALKGESAYQIWQAQPGNEGKTVEEFLTALKGNTGAPFTYDMFTPEQLEGLKGQDGVISVDAPADGKSYARKDAGWAEVEDNVYVLPTAIMNLTSSSTSQEISDAVGGINGFNAIINAIQAKKIIYISMIVDGNPVFISIETVRGEINSLLLLGYSVGAECTTIFMSYDSGTFSFSSSMTKFPITDGGNTVIKGNGDGTQSLMNNGQYKKVVTFDPVSATTLTNLPITNYSIKVTLSAASALSFASTPAEGDEFMIDVLNSSAADITQPLPNAASWQCEDTSVVLPAGKITAISVRYIHSKYVVVTK